MAVRINGSRLKVEIAARGLTQGEFAKRAGVSANTVTNAVQGKAVQQWVLARMVASLQSMPAVEGIKGLIDDRVPVRAA